MLWVVGLVYRCGGKKEHCVCSVTLRGFSPPIFPAPHFSTVYQCDGRGGSWLGCQVLPAIGAVFIMELTANGGSSRLSEAPNLHITTLLFKFPPLLIFY